MKLPAFKLERFFNKYEFKAPYLLASSDCEAMTIEELLSLESGAMQQFHQTWLGYTESPGSPELRQEIAQTYQSVGHEEILVHAGALDRSNGGIHSLSQFETSRGRRRILP